MTPKNKLFDVPFGSIYEDETGDYILYVSSCGGGVVKSALKIELEEIEPITKQHPIIRKWVTRE